jgi:hypothetical protein
METAVAPAPTSAYRNVASTKRATSAGSACRRAFAITVPACCHALPRAPAASPRPPLRSSSDDAGQPAAALPVPKTGVAQSRRNGPGERPAPEVGLHPSTLSRLDPAPDVLHGGKLARLEQAWAGCIPGGRPRPARRTCFASRPKRISPRARSGFPTRCSRQSSGGVGHRSLYPRCSGKECDRDGPDSARSSRRSCGGHGVPEQGRRLSSCGTRQTGMLVVTIATIIAL